MNSAGECMITKMNTIGEYDNYKMNTAGECAITIRWTL